MNLTNFDFDKMPVEIGALSGLVIATGILLIAFAISLYLVLLERRSGGVGGAGGVIGFIIFPVVILTGAPWSLRALQSDNLNNPTADLAIIGGNLLNGVLIGTLFGLIKKFLL